MLKIFASKTLAPEAREVKHWLYAFTGTLPAITVTVFLWRLTSLSIEGVLFWGLNAYIGGIIWAKRLMDMPERRRRRLLKGMLQMLVCGAVAAVILVPLGIPFIEVFIVTVLFGLLLGILNELLASVSPNRKRSRRVHKPDSYKCQEYIWHDEDTVRNVKHKAIKMKGSLFTRAMGMHYQSCMEELGLWDPREEGGYAGNNRESQSQ